MKALAALLILAALPAQAQSPRQTLFPTDGSCYLRQYSNRHLADHPNQLVTQIALGPEYGQAEADVLILRVAVYARGSNERFTGSAYCENTGASLSCGLEGDGGRFSLSPGKKGALTMRVGRDPLGFEGSRGFLTFGGGVSDDETFLIPRVPADACP
jgi:hypothetical protein